MQPALRLGALELLTPIVLAPMAGVTNPPFRALCRRYANAGFAHATGRAAHTETIAHRRGVGLWVTEMITSRALVERVGRTMRMITPDPGDPIRSIQLYGVDPATVGAAVEIAIREGYADHIDLNFGCPAPKVTRKGGGAALPYKRDLFAAIVRAAVTASARASRQRAGASTDPVPITVKVRKGIDADHLTFLDAGRIAEQAGAAAITLHGRTLVQHYSGLADWDAIAALKDSLSIPVLGNGDIFEADDAAAMLKKTGADGIVVGRGCQGRPWLFADLTAGALGSSYQVRPTLGEVAEVIRTHAHMLVDHLGSEDAGLRDLRKHMAWYLRGYPAGSSVRSGLARVSTFNELDELLAQLDADAPFPPAAEGPRGRAGGKKRAHLPEDWLKEPFLVGGQRELLADAEHDISGG